MRNAPPAAPAVRETLERLLASDTFSRSERARKLLRYLVERQQAGEADRLKGFAIAVDVFGKDVDFDPSTDAVVRVQAGRLRDLLRQYFDTEGAAEPFRIVIARGSYVPAYKPNLPQAAADIAPPAAAPADTAEADTVQPLPSLSRQLAFMWLAIAAVVVVLGVVLLRQVHIGSSLAEAGASSDPPATTASIGHDRPDSLPMVYISLIGEGPELATVAATLRKGLSGFDTVDFIGRDIGRDLSDRFKALSFVFRLTPGSGQGSVTIELQNAGSGRILLSRTLAPYEISHGLEDGIAGLLTATVAASGIVYGYIEQEGMQTGLTRCLLLNDDYYQDPGAATHESAYLCFEQLIEAGAKSAAAYSELAALHLEALANHYAYPPGATRDKAMAMAHRAVQMSATSPYAHRAYGFLHSRLGNTEESIRWTRKAYELNTYDLTMAAAYGYGLIFAGRYREGTPIMARAVEASSAHPPWWDYFLFLGEFMLGDIDQAIRATPALNTTERRSHYLAAQLIAADEAGDEPARRQRLEELARDFPDFAADPRRTFEERNYPPDLTDRLVEALRTAGLGASG